MLSCKVKTKRRRLKIYNLLQNSIIQVDFKVHNPIKLRPLLKVKYQENVKGRDKVSGNPAVTAGTEALTGPYFRQYTPWRQAGWMSL